jgi:reductive dehalogenase
MDQFIITSVLCGLLVIVMLVTLLYNVFEKEGRAIIVSLLSLVVVSVIYSVLYYINHTLINLIFNVSLTIFFVVLLLPIRNFGHNMTVPEKRIDERKTMFARMVLEPGSDRYNEFYKNNPDMIPLDEKFRSKPGLLDSEASKFHPLGFRAADASFFAIDRYKPFVDGEPNPIKEDLTDLDVSNFIKSWAVKLGAVEVGICELKDYHWYSTIGRGEEYGKEVDDSHKYAIAFSVEMDKDMVDAAPTTSIIMESAQQYLESGKIAIQIAQFIRSLGYNARAHIDGNYRLVCPLVGRDAGLGEIGRMGLLMNEKTGPRHRLAVVTTDLSLKTDRKKSNPAIEHFCSICKKCADVCPSAAISKNDREIIDGVERWQINSEACFTYWCQVGTDCGQCIRVCPFSHPDNLYHKMIRLLINNSVLFQYFALKMDDIFYGRRPKAKKTPKWVN